MLEIMHNDDVVPTDLINLPIFKLCCSSFETKEFFDDPDSFKRIFSLPEGPNYSHPLLSCLPAEATVITEIQSINNVCIFHRMNIIKTSVWINLGSTAGLAGRARHS